MRNNILIPIEENENDSYFTADGRYLMRREWGHTPNGNPLPGYWVLRDQKGKWIDYDQYRYDLAGRNRLTLD